MKPVVVGLAAALLAFTSLPAHAAEPPAWVAKSNQNAQVLLQARAPFMPEMASFFGVPGFDDQVADLKPKHDERFRAATQQAKAELQKRLATEKDPNVRQDLEILIKAADQSIEGSELEEKYELPWADVPQLVFQGIQGLLSDQKPPERRAHALDRLKRYVGMTPDTTPIATLARQRYEERASNKQLLRPSKLELERSLGNVDTYVSGIRQLFAKYQIAGADDALNAMDQQLHAYADWERKLVLPEARSDTQLPEPLYAFRLKRVGIDLDPKQLMQRAEVEFMEVRSMMQQLAPLVAKEHKLKVTDYREVIRALKKPQLARKQIEPYYHRTLGAIEQRISKNRIVDLPKRPMVMRLASEAESAAQPAPHFLPAPLIGNTGQQGQFVLPLGNPDKDGKGEAYDDFNFGAAAWTLSAHEGRPGHELQFTAMVERGVSLARTMFAFNSVNVEGWALYAEAEMVPYEPLDGQLIALQFRLLRAARAMLDPMLNLGLIDRARAEKVLTGEVVLSKPMARQELDRYTFDMPGQAGSYFYGYTRILQLREETELALGDRFDRMAFNNFLLDQGLLPPDLLEKAVHEQFIPSRRGVPVHSESAP